jgi:hypothetical protein
MMTCRTKWIASLSLSLAMLASASISHASAIYTFKGTVPTSIIPTNPAVSPGESWIASFVIKSVPGIYDTHSAEYPGAVVKGSLRFSGGYQSPYSFAGFNVNVHNSSDDGVAVYGTVDGHYIRIASMTDLNPLPSTAMPLPGKQFQPHPTIHGAAYYQLTYVDALGEVSYYARTSNNVSFAATEVPEPTSLAVASLLGGSLVLARRRRA